MLWELSNTYWLQVPFSNLSNLAGAVPPRAGASRQGQIDVLSATGTSCPAAGRRQSIIL